MSWCTENQRVRGCSFRNWTLKLVDRVNCQRVDKAKRARECRNPSPRTSSHSQSLLWANELPPHSLHEPPWPRFAAVRNPPMHRAGVGACTGIIFMTLEAVKRLKRLRLVFSGTRYLLVIFLPRWDFECRLVASACRFFSSQADLNS
jgi:hypothetical protein